MFRHTSNMAAVSVIQNTCLIHISEIGLLRCDLFYNSLCNIPNAMAKIKRMNDIIYSARLCLKWSLRMRRVTWSLHSGCPKSTQWFLTHPPSWTKSVAWQ